MPTKNKTRPKKSNTAQSKTGNLRSFKLKPWHILTGIALFIVGGFVIAFSRAATPGIPTKDLSIAYYDEAPSVVSRNTSSEIIVKGSRSIEVDSTGVIYCMPQNGEAGTNRQLSAAEWQALKTSGQEAVAAQADTSQNSSVGGKTLIVAKADQSGIQSISYDARSTAPASFSQTLAQLEAACNPQASNQIQRSKKPIMKQVAPEASPKTTPITLENFRLVQVAQASTGPLPNEALELLGYINTQRQRYGLNTLAIEGCMNTTAQNIANWNSIFGTLVHTSNMPAAASNTYCSSGWLNLGEIIGRKGTVPSQMYMICPPTGNCFVPTDPNTIDYRTYSSAGISYMTSPEHRNVILDPKWTRFGAGAYRSDSGVLYTSAWFMNCKIVASKESCGTASAK